MKDRQPTMRTRSMSYSQDIATLRQTVRPRRNTVDSPLIDGEDSENEGRKEMAHATQIVREMEKDSTLMDNNRFAEQLRIETLREMPQSLAVKRNVKVQLMYSISHKMRHRPVSCWRSIKFRISIAVSRLSFAIHDIASQLELWYGSLKTVEGHFGSSVATYFKFLRFLFIMNTLTSFISFLFVILPQVVHMNQNIPIDNSSILNKVLTGININATQFSFGDLFTGEGYLTDSILYYGTYTNTTLYWDYDMPKAYFCTALMSYITTFIVLSASMASSYRHCYIETAGGLKNVFAQKVFCGWDFSIASDRAAQLKSDIIARELQELLAEQARMSLQHHFWIQSFYTQCVRCSLHALHLVVLAGTGALVYHLLQRRTLLTQAFRAVTLTTHLRGDREATARSEAMLMSFIVTIILILLPKLFSWIVRLEEYHNPRTSLYITMLRTFALEVMVVAVLVGFWLQEDNRDSSQCWETSLGQEVYRLVIMDFIVSGLLITFAEVLRTQLYRFMWRGIGAPEFDISRNTLNIIHNQTLFWVGFFFSPLLPIIISCKLFLLFYIKKLGLLHNCEPSSRSWRAAQTQTLFLVLAFVSLLAVLITYGYIITKVESSGCGPLGQTEFMYQSILSGVFQVEKGNSFWKFIMFLTKPGVVGALLISMCAGVYYLRAQSKAQMQMVEILREMLVLEAKDKEYLLEKIAVFTGGRKSVEADID